MLLRIIRSFVFIIISIAILGGGFFAGIYARDYSERWQDRQVLRNLVKSYEQTRKDEEARKMADTFGGKTPQETLQMFIDAVEAGDYDLASKYFVETQYSQQKKTLENISKNNKIEWFIYILKNAVPVDKEKEYEENYQLTKDLISSTEEEWVSHLKELNKNQYEMDANDNLEYIFRINFIRYPNNIWKISYEIEMRNYLKDYILKF